MRIFFVVSKFRQIAYYTKSESQTRINNLLKLLKPHSNYSNMANQHTFSPHDIIEVARYYGGIQERWITLDMAKVSVYGAKATPAAGIKIRCRTIAKTENGWIPAASFPLSLQFKSQLLSARAKVPAGSGDLASVRYMNMSFQRLDAKLLQGTTHEPMADHLLDANARLIMALDLIADELDIVRDIMLRSAGGVRDNKNSRTLQYDEKMLKRYSFRQTHRLPGINDTGLDKIPLDDPIYRMRLPVVKGGTRLAHTFQKGGLARPVVHQIVQDADGNRTIKAMMIPVYANDDAEEPVRYDHVTYLNADRIITRLSCVWATAEFREVCIFAAGTSIIVTVRKLLLIPHQQQDRSEAFDVDESVNAAFDAAPSVETVVRAYREVGGDEKGNPPEQQQGPQGPQQLGFTPHYQPQHPQPQWAQQGQQQYPQQVQQFQQGHQQQYVQQQQVPPHTQQAQQQGYQQPAPQQHGFAPQGQAPQQYPQQGQASQEPGESSESFSFDASVTQQSVSGMRK